MTCQGFSSEEQHRYGRRDLCASNWWPQGLNHWSWNHRDQTVTYWNHMDHLSNFAKNIGDPKFPKAFIFKERQGKLVCEDFEEHLAKNRQGHPFWLKRRICGIERVEVLFLVEGLKLNFLRLNFVQFLTVCCLFLWD